MRKRSTAGFIYALQAEGSVYIKIGRTTGSIEHRLKTLQTGQPTPLHIVAHQGVETDLARIEHQIHQFLATERQQGEWFALKLDANELAALIQRAVEHLREQDEQARERALEKAARKKVYLSAVRTKREAAGLRQETLARQASMSVFTLNRIECNKQPLQEEEGIRLAQVLGCNPLELFPALQSAIQQFNAAQENTHAD